MEDPTRVLFWRDHQQHEVDFVVPRERDSVHAYECKWSALKPDLEGLLAFRAAYPQGRNFLVVPHGRERMPLKAEGLEIEILTPTHLMEDRDGGRRAPGRSAHSS